MVLPAENLMAVPNRPSAAGRSTCGRFEFSSSVSRKPSSEPTG